ncbi:MAG: hypothetical protein IJ542_00300 [Clostridia bacterium]|nr:hypothetical protein [Clostridia bacterium]
MTTKKIEPVFLDKKSVFVAPDVVFGENVIVYPNNFIDAGTTIGANVTLLPGNYIVGSTIGDGSKIQSSTIENSCVGERVIIGPNAHLRPHSKIENNVRIGNFCEIKNSTIGEGSKVSHLSYVGDAEVGKYCNIGCGAIFVNYNGVTKAKTVIEDRCFIGSNVNIIAPVTIKEGSYVCAGTTIDKSTSADDFVICRPPEIIKHNYTKKFLERKRNG